MRQHEPNKQELVQLELRYWQAIKDRDAATATSLSTDPCLVVGAQGATELSHEALTTLLATARYQLHAFLLEHVRMQQIGDDTVTLAYKVTEELTVDGRPLTLEAFDSSVWVRHGREWRCALHSESVAGDPFGRH